MSADILGTSWDQCRSMVQYCFTSTKTSRLVRTDSPGRPPRPACEAKFRAKNSSISRLWLVEIGDRMGPVDGCMVLQSASVFACVPSEEAKKDPQANDVQYTSLFNAPHQTDFLQALRVWCCRNCGVSGGLAGWGHQSNQDHPCRRQKWHQYSTHWPSQPEPFPD